MAGTSDTLLSSNALPYGKVLDGSTVPAQYLGAQHGADPRVHPGTAVNEPFAEGGLDEEAGFLGDPAGSGVADFAAPLYELDPQGGDGPLAGRPHRACRDTAAAGSRVGPVADLGHSGPAQVEPDPAEPGPGRGVVGEELGPPPAVPAGDGHLADEERGVFDPVRRGHLDELLQGWVLRDVIDPANVLAGERPQGQPARRDGVPLHASSVPGGPRRHAGKASVWGMRRKWL